MPAIVIWHATSRLFTQATSSVVQNKALIEKDAGLAVEGEPGLLVGEQSS